MNLTKGLGTPQYMAPEILEGSKQATFDFASSYDVYSYSIVAYETWTTEQAYSSLSLNHFELAEYVMAGKRPEIPKTIGPVIAEVIRQCWDQDPAKRPSKHPSLCQHFLFCLFVCLF